MAGNNFNVIFRRLFRNKLSSLIKLISLSVGITCFILISLYVFHELSFDHFQKNGSQIARLTMEYSVGGNPQQTALTGTKAGPQLERTFPAVKSYVRMIRNSVVVAQGEKIFDEKNFLFADTSFLKMFSFPLIEGNAATALNAQGKVILTRSMAKKYFGNEDPLGKILLVNGNDIYKVSGLMADAPGNSQIQFDFLAGFSNLENSKSEEWFSANYLTYLWLNKGTDIPDLERKIDKYMKRISASELEMTGGDYLTYRLQPMERVHLNSTLDGMVPNVPALYINILIAIAIFILLIACINYSNLSIALASEQKTGIGIRKVLGARNSQLLGHYLGDSFVLATLSALTAIIVAILVLPYFDLLSGIHFTITSIFRPVIILTLAVLISLVSIIAGGYPAMILSGYKLVAILKPGTHIPISGGNFRKSLIVFQFFISILLIIVTLVIQQQRKFIQNVNLGYNKSKVISLPNDNQVKPNYEALKAALQINPYVTSVSAGYETPVDIGWSDEFIAATSSGEKKIATKAIPVDLDFIKTLGIHIIAGTDFSEADLQQLKAHKDSANYYILNETAVKEIGWTPDEAIGRTINKGLPGTIVGVVSDFHMASLHETIKPLVIFLSNRYLNNILIKLKGNDLQDALTSIASVWKGRIPGRPFEFHFLDREYNAMYQSEQKTAQLFSVFSGLAIVLACLGLFGMAAIMTSQRTREIGIRKVLGATIFNITSLISMDFIRNIIIAFLISVPFAWYFAFRWLNNFAYKIGIPWWAFAAGGFFSILIALLTVSYQSIKAALLNPAQSLRNE